MRKLSKKQEKLIVEYLSENIEARKLAFNIDDHDGLYDCLSALNFYETLWSDINRFASDQSVKLIYNR